MAPNFTPQSRKLNSAGNYNYRGNNSVDFCHKALNTDICPGNLKGQYRANKADPSSPRPDSKTNLANKYSSGNLRFNVTNKK